MRFFVRLSAIAVSLFICFFAKAYKPVAEIGHIYGSDTLFVGFGCNTPCRGNAEAEVGVPGFPGVIDVQGQAQHVQGIAVDTLRGCAMFSFTSRFVKTDLKGRIIGSIDRIPGHLGAMTYDTASGLVYATLEQKDDAIGQGVARTLDIKTVSREQVSFFVAVIDVDKVDCIGMDYERVLTLMPVREAIEDYKAVLPDSSEHRFGCSGIDGIAIGPRPGKAGKNASQSSCLYVGYGIYGDISRSDNDCQVILRYNLDKVSHGNLSLERRYFVHTGNTTYGIQNLAFDPFTGYMFMAVYKGKKEQWPNYTLYAADLSRPSYRGKLEGVPYCRAFVNMLPLADDGLSDGFTTIRGWRFPYGSMGLFPVGGGFYYISENYCDDEGLHGCRATLYKWNGNPAMPFTRVK